MKYIDADRLKAEIRRIVEEETPISKGADYYHGVADAADKLLSFITSLQQEIELPEKYQTPDWIWEDKTIDQLAEEYVEGVKKCNDTPTWELIHTGVCYGYELGKNARKEEE